MGVCCEKSKLDIPTLETETGECIKMVSKGKDFSNVDWLEIVRSLFNSVSHSLGSFK
jgi:hypothetical protein